MKFAKLAVILILLASSWNYNTQIRAETKKLIYEDARQGISWKVYLLKKKLVTKVTYGGETRKGYLVDLEINNSYSGVYRQTNLIQCSTASPFVAFKDRDTPKMAILHFINPGGEISGYDKGSHWEYWVVCHELWEPWKYNLSSKARQLGYSTQLSSEQIEIPYQVMQYLR